MKEETKNLYLAIILSIGLIYAVNYFLPGTPQPVPAEPEAKVEEVAAQPAETDTQAKNLSATEVLEQDPRLEIATPALSGSVRIKGLRFDNLSLKRYKQTLDPNSEDVVLLAPSNTEGAYFAQFGWLAADPQIKVPDANTLWHTRTEKLTPETPLVLEWENGQGLKFIETISVDENYLFNIRQSVENNTSAPITLYPYGLISRHDNPQASDKRAVVHQGISAVVDGSLKEIRYTKLDQDEPENFEVREGWAGFSDRYWFSAFVLNENEPAALKFSNNGNDLYQIDYRGAALQAPAGAVADSEVRFFAGAKEIKLLDAYEKNQNIKKFDLAVDFGWYYFLTKPFFYVLAFLYSVIGNMGWAILLFAALLRLLMFPIANKSFESMSKMKKVQPKVTALQEQYKDNKQLLQQATLELYRREKINPAAGCLPLFIQIPVFFSLYKVLNISLEIRHAPFIGWIKDLSAPDPLTISVWSHIPLPALLDIGIWPILMGLTMWIQQKLNPAPANKDQARMFALMPFIFTLMLGHFASGLVIYWTLSNILSIIQQKVIMRQNGVE